MLNKSPPNRLICSDFLPVQESLPDESFDLIYIDPPFGTGRAQSSPNAESKREYSDKLTDPDEFVSWLSPCLSHSRRLLRPTGSLFVHLDYRSVHHVKVYLDQLFGRSRFVNEIIWCYSVGGKSQRRFARKHDTILWYGRSSDYAFYPHAVHVPRKPSSHMRTVIGDDGEEYQEKTDKKTGKVYRYPVAKGKVPEDWWIDIETLNRSDRERVGWPTQKPKRLLSRIICGASQPGDKVADWFSGSGTTASVAQEEGRSFVAVDRLPEAIVVAKERLQAEAKALRKAGSAPPRLSVEGLSAAIGQK